MEPTTLKLETSTAGQQDSRQATGDRGGQAALAAAEKRDDSRQPEKCCHYHRDTGVACRTRGGHVRDVFEQNCGGPRSGGRVHTATLSHCPCDRHTDRLRDGSSSGGGEGGRPYSYNSNINNYGIGCTTFSREEREL